MKWEMLGKLAYRNTKRNIKDYLIYLITVTASVSLIFAFNLVASSDEIVKLCSSMDAFKNSLFAVNILIIFVICFLINYTTKFMFEKRSKELGTYMLLGIKKKEIAHLVVIEKHTVGNFSNCISYSYWLFIQPVCVVSNCKLTGYSKNSLYFFEFCFYWTIDNLFFNYLCFGFT